MATEAELQQQLSDKHDVVSILQRQVEDSRHQAAHDTEALTRAHQQAHILQDESADLQAALHNSREDAALMQSELVSAQKQVHNVASTLAELNSERQEMRSTVAAYAAKHDDAERQLAACATEVEHLNEALSRFEGEIVHAQADARTASEACEIAIGERIAADMLLLAAGQLHEGQRLQAEAAIAQLQEAATHRLRQLQELSEERDVVTAERAISQQQLRDECTKLQQTQLRLLKSEQAAAAAESAVAPLHQRIEDLQQQLRQTAAALSAANHEAEAALALHASSLQAERRTHASLHTLIEEKELVCNDYDARQGELEFELLTLKEDVGAQNARQSLQEAQAHKIQKELSAAEEVHRQDMRANEVLTMEASKAQSTARHALSQLAEERDATGFKASRLCGIIQELRYEGLDLKVDTMQSEARRDKINSVLLSTKATANDRSKTNTLQAELTRRDAPLLAAHTDNDRLRECVGEQMETKSSLRFELQNLQHELSRTALQNKPRTYGIGSQQRKLLRFNQDDWEAAEGYGIKSMGIRPFRKDDSTQIYSVHAHCANL